MGNPCAVVLAGGQGARLQPVTNSIPKVMIRIAGKPVLQWIIEWLRDNGVDRLVLGVAHLKDQIVKFFDEGTKFGVEIKYSVHTVKGGTAEGFRLAIQRHVSDQNFYALNGDQITNLSMRRLLGAHFNNKPVVTMVAVHPRLPFGRVRIDRNRVATSFQEKPILNQLCSAGIYVFNREILTYLPKSGDIETAVFPRLVKERKLCVYPYSGLFVTINTPRDVIEVESELKRFRHP